MNLIKILIYSNGINNSNNNLVCTCLKPLNSIRQFFFCVCDLTQFNRFIASFLFGLFSFMFICDQIDHFGKVIVFRKWFLWFLNKKFTFD